MGGPAEWEGGHYVIDGRKFGGISHVFSCALDAGYIGARSTIAERLRSGCTSWTEMIKAPDAKRGYQAKAMVSGRARRAEEMAALIRELDSRKAAIAAGDGA